MEDWLKADPGKPVGEEGRAMVRRMNDSHRPLREWGFSLMKWDDHMRILDVGCGGGAAIGEMLALSAGSVIDGVDYSADCVAATSEYNKAVLNERVFVTEGNVSALPFADRTFDLVTAVETVYFWPDLSGGIREIRRVLKPGGRFAILCEVDGPERMDWDEVNFKITVYRPKELADVMEAAGFLQIKDYVKENGYMLVTGVR